MISSETSGGESSVKDRLFEFSMDEDLEHSANSTILDLQVTDHEYLFS